MDSVQHSGKSAQVPDFSLRFCERERKSPAPRERTLHPDRALAPDGSCTGLQDPGSVRGIDRNGNDGIGGAAVDAHRVASDGHDGECAGDDEHATIVQGDVAVDAHQFGIVIHPAAARIRHKGYDRCPRWTAGLLNGDDR